MRVSPNVQLPIILDLEWPEYTRIFGLYGQTSDIGLRLVSCPKFNIHGFGTLDRRSENCMGMLGFLPKCPKFDIHSFGDFGSKF